MRLGLGLRLGGALGLSQTFKARFTGTGTQYTILAPITRQITAAMTGDGTQSTELLVTKRFAPNYTGDGTLVASLESAYTPAQDTDLFDWWDAQSGVTSSGGELTAWVGSVNSEPANPPTVTSRPLYGTDTINSLDVLTFRDADPNYLDIDVSSLTTGNVIQFVIKDLSTIATMLTADAADFSNFIYSRQGNSSDARGGIIADETVTYYIDGVSIGDNISRATYYTSIASLTVLVTLQNVKLTGISTLRVGASTIPDLGLAGSIGDIIISSGSTNITENQDFLIDKYGL